MKTFSKTELDAARKRIDEAQGITDEAVEVGARAITDMEMGLTCVRLPSFTPAPWNEWPEDAKEERRKVVREVLRAVLPVQAPAHLCDTCAQSKCWTRRDIEDACEDPLLPARAVVVECGAYVAKEDVQEVTEDA